MRTRGRDGVKNPEHFAYVLNGSPQRLRVLSNVQARIITEPFVFRVPHTYLREVGQDLVALGVEYHEALVEVVVLHRGGGVEARQRRARLDLEGVVGAAVVQVVAEARDHQ